ncbi:MAG: alanine racemase [bacterium]
MRASVAIIDLDAIRFNIAQVKKRVFPSRLMAVVKANGYGHGAFEVARAALGSGATYLGVALMEEGIELREKGITAPILIFGGFFPGEIDQFLKYDLELALCTNENLQAIKNGVNRFGKKARVHVKVDTGMGRVGIPIDGAADFVSRVAEAEEVDLEGLYMHFATADEKDKSFANLQLKRFRGLIEELEGRGIQIPLKHAANSGAILDLDDSFFDLVRPGIMMYGYYPSRQTSESVALKPALTLKSQIIQKKRVDAGDSVSYGRTFIAQSATEIATIPIGYADGYNRLLSNRGMGHIAGEDYPVVGRVCMDQIMIDVGLDSQVSVGDEVILMGPDYGEAVHMNNYCQILQTIPYEICCRISERVPRIYLNAD